MQLLLSVYGWSKCQLGKYKGAFYNPRFHRDKGGADVLFSIERNGPPSSGKKQSSARVLASQKTPPLSSDSSSDEDELYFEEMSPAAAPFVTLSGRKRVTPVRYTDAPKRGLAQSSATVKVAMKQKAAHEDNVGLTAEVTSSTASLQPSVNKRDDPKSLNQTKPQIFLKSKAKSATKRKLSKKVALPTKKSRSSTQPEPRKPPQPIKRGNVVVAVPTEFVQCAPSPTATMPSKVFAAMHYDDSVDAANSERWGFDTAKSASVPPWSSLMDEGIQSNQARQLLPQMRTEETPGTIRLNLFQGAHGFSSPIIMSPGRLQRQTTGNMGTEPPDSLDRSTSGCSVLSSSLMPLPLLRKQSSSFYGRELSGYIPALQAALGVTMPDLTESIVGADVDTSTYQINHPIALFLPPRVARQDGVPVSNHSVGL